MLCCEPHEEDMTTLLKKPHSTGESDSQGETDSGQESNLQGPKA